MAILGALFIGTSFAQTGTQIEIGTWEDFVNNVYFNPSGNFIQTSDIVIPDNGFTAANFSGTYDGAGYKFTSSATQQKAMFGQLSGTVKNVVLSGLTYNFALQSSNNQMNGAICTQLMEEGVIEYCSVENCELYQTNSSPRMASQHRLGGLVGYNSGIIRYSLFSSKLNLTVSGSLVVALHVGGIVGYANSGEIVSCMSSGEFSLLFVGTGADLMVNGIACTHNRSLNIAVSNCYSSAQMSGGNTHIITNNSNCQTPQVPPEDLEGQDLADYLNSTLPEDSPAYIVNENGDVVLGNSISSDLLEHGIFTSRTGVWNKEDAGAWIREDADENVWIISAGSKITFTENTTDSIIVKDGGQLVAKGELSNVVVEKGFAEGWNFIGLPVDGDSQELVSSMAADDIEGNFWALEYNYNQNTWDGQYLHVGSEVLAGNGIFAWAEDRRDTIRLSGAAYKSNLPAVTVTNNINSTNSYRWMALANPYSENLDIETFLANAEGVQGMGVYLHDGSTFREAVSEGEIKVGEGFFVNMPASDNSIVISNAAPISKSVQTRDYLTLSVSTDGYKVPVRFALNEAASESYDIFDANKMLGDGTVAEPYFVKSGIRLCKEEVNRLPYTATMNVYSDKVRQVEIIADRIPEDYSLILADGTHEVELQEGDTYTTPLLKGNNENRFRLKIGSNAVSIQETKETENVELINNNRIFTVIGGKGVRVEVYDVLGQKIFETRDRSFELNALVSGVYVVKVLSGSEVFSSKVVIR